MNLIEEGRNRMVGRENFASTTQTIFDSAISLVKGKGERSIGCTVVEHRFYSDGVPVLVSIGAEGKNPEKAKKIFVRIQGHGELEIHKKRSDKFKVGEVRGLYEPLYASHQSDVDKVRAYHDVVKQVETALETK